MGQPTTPHALPLARTSRGNISAGYSHGTVSQVAPKIAVNRNTKNMAAAPGPDLCPGAVSAVTLESSPTRKQQIPMPIEPQ